jgi:hypothetical protein
MICLGMQVAECSEVALKVFSTRWVSGQPYCATFHAYPNQFEMEKVN